MFLYLRLIISNCEFPVNGTGACLLQKYFEEMIRGFRKHYYEALFDPLIKYFMLYILSG